MTARDQPLAVLHITTFLQGGAGRAVTQLAIDQRTTGDTVTVVTSPEGVPGYGSYPEHLAALRDAGVTLHCGESTFERELATMMRAVGAIRAAVDLERVDVIHTHAAVPSLIGLVLAARAAPRAVVLQTMHGWGIRKTADHERTDVAVLCEVDAVVTPSHASRSLLIGKGIPSRHVEVVPYGLERLEHGRPERDPVAAEIREAKERGAAVIICLGTVCPRKNQHLLVEALSGVDSDRELAVFVVGEGEVEALEATARTHGVADVVRCCGYRARAHRYLTDADILVLPSLDEGLSVTVLEAFRAGAIVVASDIPSLAEVVVPGETGFLFRSGDARALAEELERAIVASPETLQAIREQARRMFEDRFTVDRMCTAYRDLYARLTARCTRG